MEGVFIQNASGSGEFLASGTGLFLALLTSALAFFEGHKAHENLVKVIWQTFAIVMLLIVGATSMYFHFWLGAVLGSFGIAVEVYCVRRRMMKRE